MNKTDLEFCKCPYCGIDNSVLWAREAGFNTVRCLDCDYLYLNPRPNAATREKATELGMHGAANDMDIRERYVPKKVKLYKTILQECFPDVWASGQPITWIDIGAGYGEVMEAVTALAPAGSKIIGLEPMVVKSQAARERGLNVISSFIGPDVPKCEYASLINVFSHVNDFDAFLREIASVVQDGGELLIETGDMEGLKTRDAFPGELGSPDHVAFASGKHLRGFLERNGFDVISMHRASIDGYVYTLKNLVKKAIGRDVALKWPYSSPYRTIRVRAKKRMTASH